MLAAAGSAGCGGTSTTGPAAPGGTSPARLTVVAAIAPLADLAERVAGDRAAVLTLIPPGASEHTWEPSPRDAARVRGAGVFFKVGLGFEAWAGKLVTASDGEFETVDASEGVDLIHGSGPGAGEAPHEAEAHHGPGGSADGTGAGTANPHYWLDPVAMKGGVRRLAEALARKDPPGAAGYRERADRALADLDALDAELRERTARFESKSFIAFHGAWDYFARRYGLTVLGAIEEFPGKEPGPRHVGDIVALVRGHGIRAIFAEPQYPPKAAEVVAAECGVPVLILDPLGGKGVPGRGDYFSLMRYNVGVMEQALR